MAFLCSIAARFSRQVLIQLGQGLVNAGAEDQAVVRARCAGLRFTDGLTLQPRVHTMGSLFIGEVGGDVGWVESEVESMRPELLVARIADIGDRSAGRLGAVRGQTWAPR